MGLLLIMFVIVASHFLGLPQRNNPKKTDPKKKDSNTSGRSILVLSLKVLTGAVHRNDPRGRWGEADLRHAAPHLGTGGGDRHGAGLPSTWSFLAFFFLVFGWGQGVKPMQFCNVSLVFVFFGSLPNFESLILLMFCVSVDLWKVCSKKIERTF